MPHRPLVIEEDTPLLQDSERLFELVKRGLGVLIGLFVMATALSFGWFYLGEQEPFRVFVATTLGWSGYLFAHYAATGKFIHQKQEQSALPTSGRNILGGIFGTLLLTSGLTLWALSIGENDLLTAIMGGFIALLGYVIAHYEFTGDLL